MFDFLKRRCENFYLYHKDGKLKEFYDWPNYYVVITMLSAFFNLLAFLAAFYTICAILSRKNVRGNSFNLYVVFLLIPDALNAAVGFFWEFYRIERCGMVPKKLGDFYDINIFFYFVCNFTLNVVLAWELHRLLEQARRFSRTGPPPLQRTLWMVGGAYVFAILFAVWGAVDTPWTWYYLARHRFGSPQPGGWFTEVQAIAFVGALMLAEILFVVGCRIVIRKKGLFPRRGRTREASLFFERIVIVFLVFYFPTVGLLMVTSVIGSSYDATYFWIERTLQFLGALQVFVTLWFIAQKPDIKSAMTCGERCCYRKPTTTASGRGNSTPHGLSVTGRLSVTELSMPAPPFNENSHNNNPMVVPSELLSSELIHNALVSENFANPTFVDLQTVSEWDMDDIYGSDVEEIVFRSEDKDETKSENEESVVSDKLFVNGSNGNGIEDVNEDHANHKETAYHINHTDDSKNDDGGYHENGRETLPFQ